MIRVDTGPNSSAATPGVEKANRVLIFPFNPEAPRRMRLLWGSIVAAGMKSLISISFGV